MLPAPVRRGSEGEELRRYVTYITEDKVGLLLLPHNGNPHNSSCLLAHPGKVCVCVWVCVRGCVVLCDCGTIFSR